MEVLRFPIAGNHAWHLPNPAAYGVRVGVVFDRDDVRVERNVFFKLGFAVRIGDEVGGQHRVGLGENIEHGTVHLEKLSGRIIAHQQLGKHAWAGRVLGVATRRAEGDRQVVGDVVHQVHAAVVGVGRRREVALGQHGAGMGQRVNLDTKSVTEPLLQKGFTGRDGVAKDAQRSAAIDLLEPIQDGAAERLVDLGIAHVVDAKGHNGLDAFFTNPLRRGQPRKGKPNMEWVFPVKVSQTIGRGIRLRLAKRSQQKKGGRDRLAEAAHYAVAKRHESGTDHALRQVP